jgi:hypothetical protein
MPDLPDPVPDPEAPAPAPSELRGLRLLRVLVTILTAVMIVGIVALVVLMARGLGQISGPSAPLPALPDTLELPEGASVQAVTAGPGWWAVVTEAGDILLFDAGGALMRRIPAPELAGG